MSGPTTARNLRFQPGDTAAAQICARLVADPYDETKITEKGSAFRIAKNLYVTARHFLIGYAEDYGHQNNAIQAPLWAIHVRPGPEYSIWQINEAWLHPWADLALLHSTPYNDTAANEGPAVCATLTLDPPRVGGEVVAFGYAYRATMPVVIRGDNCAKHIELGANPATSVGKIVDVLPTGRPNLQFPCFQFDSHIDGGMSGGPILNRQGIVCGVALYSLEESPVTNGDFISYGAQLAPLMGLTISVGIDGKPVQA